MLPLRCRCGVRRLAFAALLLIQVGCSSTSFFYNRLDTLINWYVDDYVTLTRDQRAEFDNQLNELLTWHRREELPRYADLLTQFENDLDPELEPEAVERLFQALSDAADRLEIRSLDLMVGYGASLSQEQRLEFMDGMQREQGEQREEMLSRSDQQYLDDVRERFADNLARFMGRLTPEQKALIDQRIAGYRRLDGPWLDDREQWLAQLQLIVAEDAPDWPAQVWAVLEGREANRSSDYRDVFDNNSRISRDVFREVINQRTAKQDKRLRRKINGYRGDFIALAAQADQGSVKQ